MTQPLGSRPARSDDPTTRTRPASPPTPALPPVVTTTPTLRGRPPVHRPAARPAPAPRPAPRSITRVATRDLPGFGEYLVESGILSRERLRAAEAYQRSMKVQLSTAIVTLGLAASPRIEWAVIAHHARVAREGQLP